MHLNQLRMPALMLVDVVSMDDSGPQRVKGPAVAGLT